MSITDELFALQDKKYAEFQIKLTPGIKEDCIIGVRVPEVRALARTIYKDANYEEFLKALPHRYYDENMLHGLIISEYKDYDSCVRELECFLPYVDNWAVCDSMSPKIFAKHKQELLVKIKEWSGSKQTYMCRFGIKMLMTHFLDKDFKPEYLSIPASIETEEYYIDIMIAWYFATALAKQWDATIPYIEENRLKTWVHNKTIQKAIESYRITDEQKMYLRILKR